MAGTIIADKIQTENTFLTLNVGATQIATMNTSGIYSSSGTKMIGTDGTIGVATIANTAITGNIISSQIAPSVTLTTPIISGNLNLDSAGTTGVRVPSANTISFHTAGTEDVRIDATGNVGVGTSGPTEKLDVRANATFGSAVGTDASIHIQSGYDVDIKYLTRLTTDYNGVFSVRTGSTASANTPSSAVISERMRINNTGQVLVGATTTVFTNDTTGGSFQGSQTGGGKPILEVINTSSSSSADGCPAIIAAKASSTTSSSARFMQFSASSASQPMGGIVGNGATNCQFASISDAREKTNIEEISGSLQKINALKPVEFDWVRDGSHVNAGFVAQDVQEVFPEFVVENMSDEGQEQRYGLTGGMTGGIIAHLVKAIQEQQAIITDLKARIEVLEA